MAEGLKLLAILAHPDDESLAAGSTLASYASAGVAVHLVTATRGERGRYFSGGDRPDDRQVGRVREAELRAAASELGLRSVELFDYPDGGVDRADPAEITAKVAALVRSLAPDVVVTFDPFGAYGHPDHVAISQIATAAVHAAADARLAPDHGAGPHTVPKLYYLVEDADSWAAFERAFERRLGTKVDGEARVATAWPEWAITTRIDTGDAWRTAWRAIRCHETQMAIYSGFDRLTEEELAGLWRVKSFYRAFSLVNGGRAVETDLFEGLR